MDFLTQIEPGLSARVAQVKSQHSNLYRTEPTLIVRSPGRAEIIGNHVDYCGGAVLAGAISQSTLIAISKTDGLSQIYSEGFSETPAVIDSAATVEGFDPLKPNQPSWLQLASSVLHQLSSAGLPVSGFNATVTSTVTSSGGVSSSASFGVGLGLAISELFDGNFTSEEVAKLCQAAEHGIGSMCGLLDQYAVSLGQQNSLLLLDFGDDSAQVVKGDLGDNSFVVVFDPSVRRNLAETGYLARRQSCEEGLALINQLSDQTHESLRSVSYEMLSSFQDQIKAHSFESSDGETVFNRLRHVVTEIQRVTESVEALQNNDAATFGELMTASGASALGDYGLDEGTPELTYLVGEALKAPGVLGVRNMGGGFSSVSLALVNTVELKAFTEYVEAAYKAEFGADLEFVEFVPSAGASVI